MLEVAALDGISRVRGNSPVLYRREYNSQLKVKHDGKMMKHPLSFALELDPLGHWKVTLFNLDKSCVSIEDEVIRLISSMEKNKQLL